jgi:hypothetical protein
VSPGTDLPRAAAAAASLGGAGPLERDDVVRPAALVARLRDPSDPVGAYLRGRFTEAGRARVDAHDGADPAPPALQQTVVDELNGLLASDRDLWCDAAFKDVRVRAEVRARLRRPAAPADRAWKNRFRLEVALPELQRRPLNQLEAAGADLFTPDHRRVYADAIERSMGRLESLGAIDADTRERLWDPVLFGSHHLAVLQVQKAAVQRRLRLGALVAAGVILLGAPLLAWGLAGRPRVSAPDIVQVFRYIAIVAAALVAIGALVGLGGWLSTQFLLRRVHDIRYYAIAFVSWPGLVMAYSAFQVRTLLRLGTPEAAVEAAGLVAAAGLWLVLLAWLGASEAGRWGLDRWFEEDHPDVVVVDGLLTSLAIVDADRDGFWLLDTRQRLADEFERMAACVERVFPRRFEGRAAPDPWAAQTARELALGLRKLKRWVATPLRDTAEHLVAGLRADLVHAAAGAWGHLERGVDEVPAPPGAAPSLRERALGGVRTIVVAGLPLAAVAAAGPYGLAEPLRTQLTVSAAAWAVLTILLYLDPSSSRQLAALRDALPHGKGKE